MKKSLIILALVAGCGASGRGQGDGGGAGSAAGAAGPLIGLYQSGAGVRASQMCILRKADKAQFGVTVWGRNLRACSGAGTATLSGERLTLVMAGDSPCTLDATLKGGIVAFPASIPATCAYYCGAGASFADVRLTKQGSTRADALKAKDVAGEPLCG
jgi:ethanolamine utilization microcompartment shell protein EutL